MDSADGATRWGTVRTRWAGRAGCAWALAYVPIHVYWALTGSTWPVGDLPESIAGSWRQTNWAASVVITGAAVLSLALVQPWGRRLPRWMLLGVAWLGAVFALLHTAGQTTQIVLNMTGVTDGAVTTFDRWNLFVFEPWFMVMGILLAVAAVQFARRAEGPGPARPGPAPSSPLATVSAGFVLVGALVVLVGVMAFEPWAYAAVGPGLLGVGAAGRLAARRRSPA